MSTTATWTRRHEFAIRFAEGEEMVVASVPRAERPGPGPSPMDLVQAAVAGCTGIDVVLILEKMRKPLQALRVEVEATRREEEPRIFTHLALTYHVEGDDLPEESVRRAVKLSQEKYCSVAAMLQPTVALDYQIVLNGQSLD
jgi:putative redox protein